MPDSHATAAVASPANQASALGRAAGPVLPRFPAALAIKPLPLRQAVRATTALSVVCASAQDWWRLAGIVSAGDTPRVPVLLVLLYVADPMRQASDDLLRPIIRVRHENPMHREAPRDGRAIAHAVDGAAVPAPRPTAPSSPPERGAAAPASSAPSGATAEQAQPTMHAEPYGYPVPAPSACHNPMHREPYPDPQRHPARPHRPVRQDPMHHEPAVPSRPAGPLRNGNPRGNPNLAPRCGAKTRSGCPCRAPALRGKRRCRMHGGASTGPRTAEGLQRLRSARTIHGAYAAETRARDRFLRSFARRSVLFCTAVALKPFLPPVAAARLDQRPPELSLTALAPGQPAPARPRQRLRAHAEAEALAPWRQAIALGKAARRRHAIAPEDLRQLEALFATLPRLAGARSHRIRQDSMHREPPQANRAAFPSAAAPRSAAVPGVG